jgi:AcrR family transcriptional regulator
MSDRLGVAPVDSGARPAIGTGRRQRKTEATRTALEDAAWALFEEHGFGATTIEDITERVDVSVRTFFRHFPSKESVLFGDARALEGPFRRALLGRPPGESPCRSLRAALRELAPLVEAQRDRHLLRHRILQEPGGPKIEDHLGALTEKGTMLREVIAERMGSTVDDPGTQLLAGVVATIMDVTYRQWIATGGRADLSGLVNETFDSLAHLMSLTA